MKCVMFYNQVSEKENNLLASNNFIQRINNSVAWRTYFKLKKVKYSNLIKIITCIYVFVGLSIRNMLFTKPLSIIVYGVQLANCDWK